MSKKIVFILLFIFSCTFLCSIYFKYVKTGYVKGIEKVERSSNNPLSRELNLNQAIAFLENLEEVKNTSGITNVEGDENAKTLKRLKTRSNLYDVGMVLSLLVITRVIVRWRKSIKQALPLS